MLSDANLTAIMGQSRGCQLGLLMSTPLLFPLYLVAFTGELFSMVEKYRSPLPATMRNPITSLLSLD